MRPGGQDERGASAVEYALVVFAVSAVIAAILFAFGDVVTEMFGDSCQEISGQVQNTGCP